MNKIIVAVEGISYAGKTSLSKHAEANLTGIKRIYELSEKYGNGEQFPAFAKNQADCKQNDDWFFRMECKRNIDIYEHENMFNIIMDRSFLSSLCYSYSREKTYNLGKFIDTKKQILKKGVFNWTLIEPYFVYLKMDYQTYLRRKTEEEEERIQKLGLNAVINCSIPIKERDFIHNQIEFFDLFFKKNISKVLILDAAISVQDNINILSKWMSTLINKTTSIYEYDI